MLTYTITIGRNVGDEPMSAGDWREFQSLVLHTLERVLEPHALFTYEGTGEWHGDEEESVAYMALSDVEADLTDHLTMLAAAFGQEAIGWAAGESRLAMTGEEIHA